MAPKTCIEEVDGIYLFMEVSVEVVNVEAAMEACRMNASFRRGTVFMEVFAVTHNPSPNMADNGRPWTNAVEGDWHELITMCSAVGNGRRGAPAKKIN